MLGTGNKFTVFHEFVAKHFDESEIENYRIKRVWDQNLESGTPPENFFYGTELSSANSIFNAATDNMDDSHGTHVAGIAAGSGFGLAGDELHFPPALFNKT